MHQPTPQRPTLAQVVLGLFVVWQLFFLGAANVIGLLSQGGKEEGEVSDCRVPPIPERGDLVQTATHLVGGLTGHWAKWTGQIQAWWLFAPEVPEQATFPVVELRWDSDQ